jgi:RND family efflux transporter MFP subunit
MVLPGRYSVAAAAACVALLSSACLPMLSVPGQTAAGASTTTQASTVSTTSGTIRIGKSIRGDLTGVLIFTAPIQAKGAIAIIPRVASTLTKLNVDVGSKVRLGDTLAELDHSDLDEQVLAAQAAQASAEARLAELKAGPKPEALAAAQANYNAAAARVKALQSASSNTDIPALDQRVKDAQAALAKAQAALQPDAHAVAQAEAAVQTAQSKLSELQADPTKSKDQAAVNAAKADVQKANDALTKARAPTGTQAAVTDAINELVDAQQAQLIARLSTTAFDLDQARALLDVADAQLKLANAPASPEELQAAQAAVERAFSEAELARARARNASITAPISGIVTDITAAVGSSVGPSASIMTLIPPDMQVVVSADETQLSQLQVGQSANLSIESFPRDAFSGTVKAIAPVLDPRTRTAAVEIDIPDPQSKLKPGMFAQLAIQLGQHQATLLVPKEAVIRVGSVDPTAPPQNVVFTVANGRVHKQVVSPGVSDGKNTEIVQGLDEGVDLVLNPRPDFLEGELITAT